MKLIRTNTHLFVNSLGQVLKLQDDDYVEPNPDYFQVEVEVDAGQVITLPTINSFNYVNTLGNNVNSGVLVYNYFVNWGDGSKVDQILTFNSPLINHTYITKGKYVIEISSPTRQFPAWDCQTVPAIRLFITRVISWGDVGLKKMNLSGCTALVTLPDQRSKLTTLLTAQHFCSGCTSLSSIPYGIFFKTDTQDMLATDFSQAFYNNTKILSLNSELFRDCIEARNFTSAFSGCSKITVIPAELFSTCPKVSSFSATFANCILITGIPATLFLYNTAAQCNFESVFSGCSALISVPANLFDTVHGTDFSYSFYQCSNLETIPTYLFLGQNLCTSFYMTFGYCYKLQNIPTGVFDISVDGINVCVDMGYTFMQCGTHDSITTFTIANNLFDHLYKVITFYKTFYDCTKFVGIPNNLFINCVAAQNFYGTFYNNKHSEIPAGLFSTCVEALDFSACFMNNHMLLSSGVPADLFANCTKAVKFGSSFNAGTFQNCNNVGFTTIPANLFSNCYNASLFIGTFAGCTYLSAIPVDLLRYCTATTNVSYMFRETGLTTLSDNVFKYNRSIISVAYTFAYCANLTSIHEDLFNTFNSNANAIVDFSGTFQGCQNTGFTSIPANLFRYSVNAKLFAGTFDTCSNVTSIPAGLFAYNPLIENLSNCFRNWIMTSIPDNLFDGLTQVNTVANCFYNCCELLAIPATLFDDIGINRTVTFSYCFMIVSTNVLYNKITGVVPALWLKPNSPIGTLCFRNRTLISNYADIPSTWK